MSFVSNVKFHIIPSVVSVSIVTYHFVY